MIGQSMERFPYGFDEFVSISSITKPPEGGFYSWAKNVLSSGFIART
jgi:hypothetical protein